MDKCPITLNGNNHSHHRIPWVHRGEPGATPVAGIDWRARHQLRQYLRFRLKQGRNPGYAKEPIRAVHIID
jgi:hypothetical protein